MKNLRANYFYVYFQLLLLFIVVGCEGPNTPINAAKNKTKSMVDKIDAQSLSAYFDENCKPKKFKDFRAVLILADYGCAACSKWFSSLIDANLADTTLACIIASNGQYYDISHYSNNNRNIFIRENYNPIYKILFKQSTIHFLTGGNIDTSLNITATQLNSDYILNRLKL